MIQTTRRKISKIFVELRGFFCRFFGEWKEAETNFRHFKANLQRNNKFQHDDDV